MSFNIPGIHFSGDFNSQLPVIVLLHSSLSSSKQWWPLISLAKSDFRIINVDLLGYGDANDVEDESEYSFEVEKKRVLAALSEFSIESYHLVGHSFGGALALKIAVEHPECVLSLSVYEPVAFHLFEKGMPQYDEARTFSNQVLQNEPYQAAEIFTTFWNKPGFFKGLPSKMQDMMASDMAKVNLDFYALISEKYTKNKIKKITAPVLLMSGKQSPHLAHDIITILKAALPQAKLVSFNAGHMAPVNRSEEVQGVTFEFLTNLPNEN